MINVLILPHAIPHKKLKARTLEIAKELSKDQIFKIFYLERGLMRDDLLYGIKNGFKKSIVYRQIDKIIFIRIPYIPALIEPLLTYNRGIIKKIIKDLNIHLIINNFSHSFSISPSNKYVYIYDYVDDYASFHKNIFIKILMNNFIKKEVKKADFLTVGTTSLGERIKRKKWKARYMWLISGIDESLFKKVDLVKIDEIKKNYNINDKIIIGDIGYHDKKAGTDFIIEVYIKASKKIPNLALMIVGGGPEIIRLKYKYRNEKNILFIGPVPQEEVANYFLATDIGVLPYINHPSVHARFPIRLLDFIAARKIVISWPFGDLRLLNFPNVIIAERQVDKWVEAISKAIDIKWQPEWDYLLKELSMKKIIDDFKKQIFVLLEEKKIKY